jgi:ectoine hydroxylase-related dioxygenase (phytanoyl-CoA dioxygenase family)
VIVDDPGYAIVDDVFSDDELAPVVAALDSELATRSRAGARHVLAIAEIRALAGEARLIDLAERFVGPAQPFRATLFDKSASANWLVAWHQDTALPMRAKVDAPGWGPWSTKGGIVYAHAPASALTRVVALRVSLDPSTDANGPLRVLPGTHRHGLLDAAAVERLGNEIAPVSCTVGAGGVIAMRPLVLHASSKSTSDARRRVLHIEYAATTCFGPGLELALGSTGEGTEGTEGTEKGVDRRNGATETNGDV